MKSVDFHVIVQGKQMTDLSTERLRDIFKATQLVLNLSFFGFMACFHYLIIYYAIVFNVIF